MGLGDIFSTVAGGPFTAGNAIGGLVPDKPDSSIPDTAEAQRARRQITTQGEYQKSLNDQAKENRKNLKGVQQQYYSSANDQARSDLAAKMAGVQSQSNARGLLYSGQNQLGQAGAMQDYASQLATARQNINAATLSQAQQMDKAAQSANIGQQGLLMDQARFNQSASEDAYQNALKAYQAQAGGNAAIGGALGRGAGMGLGLLS